MITEGMSVVIDGGAPAPSPVKGVAASNP